MPGGPDRARLELYSEGHNPPRFVDESLPTYETEIHAEGGPGGDDGQGSNPWVLGSKTLGSNRVWMIDRINLQAGSGPAFFKVRHSRSGSATDVEGGTIETFQLQTAGQRDIVGGHNDPLLSIRGPGTVELLGFGARQNRSRSDGTLHETLGTNPGEIWSARVKGQVL